MIKLPETEQLEQAVIGACLLGGIDATQQAVATVPRSAFFNDRNADAFDLLRSMAEDGAGIDGILFANRWKTKHGDLCPDILAYEDQVASAEQLPAYIRELCREHQRRSAILAADRIRDQLEAGDITPAEAATALEEATGGPSHDEVQVYDAKAMSRIAVDDLEARWQQATEGRQPYHLTGIDALDNVTDGIGHGEMIVVGARPSVGKSAFAVTLAANMAISRNIPFTFVSTEMTGPAFWRRLIAFITGIDSRILKRMDAFTERDMAKVQKALQAISAAPLRFIDATAGISDSQIRSICASSPEAVHGGILAVDYLQNVRATRSHEKRTYEVGGVSQCLQGISRRFNVAVIALAQLNREASSDNRQGPSIPQLKHLRDSGQIEQDADQVWLLHRHKQETTPVTEDALIIVAKARDGMTAPVTVSYTGRHSKWADPPKPAQSPRHNSHQDDDEPTF